MSAILLDAPHIHVNNQSIPSEGNLNLDFVKDGRTRILSEVIRVAIKYGRNLVSETSPLRHACRATGYFMDTVNRENRQQLVAFTHPSNGTRVSRRENRQQVVAFIHAPIERDTRFASPTRTDLMLAERYSFHEVYFGERRTFRACYLTPSSPPLPLSPLRPSLLTE